MDTAETYRKISRNHWKSRLLDCMIPCAGCANYLLFSATITVPRNIIKFVGKHDALTADILWLNAHFGIGLYLYRCNFMRNAGTTTWRITYTVFCTVMFNFGSALIWGTVRSLMYRRHWGSKLLFGIISGMGFLYVGWHLVSHLNALVSCVPEKDKTEN